MSVLIKYIVVRNGVEKMTFATKKEADAYDKQLDIAENLQGFLAGGVEGVDEAQLEALALFMAERSAEVTAILKGTAPERVKAPAAKPAEKASGGQNKAKTPA